MKPILEIAQQLDLGPNDLEPYGYFLAKLGWNAAEALRTARPRGKLVLVTGMLRPARLGRLHR